MLIKICQQNAKPGYLDWPSIITAITAEMVKQLAVNLIPYNNQTKYKDKREDEDDANYH